MEEHALLRTIDKMCGGIGVDFKKGDLMWSVSLPGVTARASNIQSPMTNAVGMADFTGLDVSEGVQAVIDQYREQGKIFGWLVGPTAKPENLGEILTGAGLIKLEEECMYGMVLRNLNQPISSNPKIRVEQVSYDQMYANRAMFAEAYGFGMSEEVAETIIRLQEAIGALQYLAFVEGREEPVAFSTLVIDETGEVVALGGAATIEAYRGQGIYSTLVAKRLEDAKKLGCTTAIVQAVKGTSAPICKKLGFETVCEIDFYADFTAVEKSGVTA